MCSLDDKYGFKSPLNTFWMTQTLENEDFKDKHQASASKKCAKYNELGLKFITFSGWILTDVLILN